MEVIFSNIPFSRRINYRIKKISYFFAKPI